MTLTLSQLYPFLLVAGFIFVLNILFCCYLMKLKREGTVSRGYKEVRYCSRMANDVCAVCLEEFRAAEKVGLCPCSHNFHVVCISKWLEAHETCPICQTRVRPEQVSERTRLVHA